MMKSKLKLMPVLVSVILINGCTVLPGSNMSTMGKDVIKQQDADFDIVRMVNVYPLTPRLVEQLRPRPNVAQLICRWTRRFPDISTGSARGMS